MALFESSNPATWGLFEWLIIGASIVIIIVVVIAIVLLAKANKNKQSAEKPATVELQAMPTVYGPPETLPAVQYERLPPVAPTSQYDQMRDSAFKPEADIAIETEPILQPKQASQYAFIPSAPRRAYMGNAALARAAAPRLAQ